MSCDQLVDKQMDGTERPVTRSWAKQRLGFALPPVLTKSVHWANVTTYKLLGSHRTFVFEGRDLRYFYHRYNNTASNERTIEIPIVEQFLRPHQNVLEVGNVLNHYHPFPHDVVDKYEVAAGVANCDVVEYSASKRYDLVISISTIEHVGWDEPTREPDKPIRAISALTSFMAQDATMVITVPGGYNPFLDEFLESGSCKPRRHHRYQRMSWLNQWREVENFSPGVRYRHPYPFANTLHVLIF
ncbi:MAG: hypothetical protein WB952_20485 [Terriglobales bacterium]